MASQNSPATQLEPISATFQPKPQRKSNKPPIVKQTVIAKAMIGTSNNQISKDLGIDPSTVKAILSSSEVQQNVDAIRSQMVLDGDLLLTRRNLRKKLESGSESVTLAVARGYGILKNNPETTINVLNVGAASYAQRMELRQIEAIDVETSVSAENTPTNSVPPSQDQ